MGDELVHALVDVLAAEALLHLRDLARRDPEVARNVVEAIITAREEKGRFTSFDDFLAKCPAVVCNKRTIESLIKAGAFDDLGHPRQGLVMVHEEYVDAFVSVKRQEAVGQVRPPAALAADLLGHEVHELAGLAEVGLTGRRPARDDACWPPSLRQRPDSQPPVRGL